MRSHSWHRRKARSPARRQGLGWRGTRGFTLIEVLVVVAIIALLIAILMPSLNRARAQARTVQCGSNVRQMGFAMSMFATEHKDFVPRGLSRHGGTIDPKWPVNWVRMAARSFGNKNSYLENFNRVPVEKYEIYACPQRSREYGGVFLDYVINSMDHRGPINTSGCQQDPKSGTWWEVEGVTRRSVWRRTADVVYITEAIEESWNVVDPNNSWGTMRGIRENIETIRAAVPPNRTGFDWFDVPGGRSVPTYKEFVDANRAPRASLKMHLERGSNAVFVDGHVELLKPPKETAGPFGVMRYYIREFGVDPDVVDQCTVTATSALPANHPCAVGDTTWRP